MPWTNVDEHSDPNDMWRERKEMFLSCVDKHAPLKSKRVRKKRWPWITGDLLCKTRRRDFLKKKVISSSDSTAWHQYKLARNQANNAIKVAFYSFIRVQEVILSMCKFNFCTNILITNKNPYMRPLLLQITVWEVKGALKGHETKW